MPKANRLSESKRRRTYAGGPDGYRPVGTAMEGYRGGIGAVSPPVTWESWFRMPVLFFGESGDKYNVHIIYLYIYTFIYILFYIDNILNINDINDQKPTVVWGSEQAYIRLYSLPSLS